MGTVRLLREHRRAAGLFARRLRGERGVAMVEFAILLPVLLMILLGIVQFGLYISYSDDETHLAEEAVRFAAVDSNPASSGTLQNYVYTEANPALQGYSLHVYIYFPTSDPSPNNTVGNAVRACVTASVPAIPILNLGAMTLTQSATMRLEQAQTAAQWTPDSIPSACPAT